MYEFEIKSSIFIEPNQIQTQILKFFAKKSANQWKKQPCVKNEFCIK